MATASTDSAIPSQAIDATIPPAAASPITTDTSTQPPRPTPSIYQPPANPFLVSATCTLYAFPSLEPVSFTSYPQSHLLLPLRRDILHRAIVYEGDKTRQGTASTKWRGEVHGSNVKIRPQKGTGRARLGDKKSPMLKGGGVAFGPKPRDFSTDLPRKVYDLAWRTALSYRYRRGELVVLHKIADFPRTGPGAARWVKELLDWQQWGNQHGRTLFVTLDKRAKLAAALESGRMGKEARVLDVEDVDVKDLLEMGRVVIEKNALDLIFRERSSDLDMKIRAVA